ncbi:unnamed protein product [Adineta ricciae]|uniref:G-protein coupled receptors family 1 profile domain-containing protein n=1 Tax=Adineta ricciae TaxID=249248 RepID=A0A816DT74_ADIRI|nr:unnamed protein product [Adineta ricciae]CAF1641577.1 unnamed protein product [Adineta ricciae]
MSQTSNLTVLSSSIPTNLYRHGGPILMIMGTIGSILSLIVFTKKNLRKNPCSIYFTAFNIANIFLIYLSLFITVLALGYNINPSLYNRTFCRFRFYAMVLFDVLNPSYLILASIDRLLITSPRVRIRHRSTPRLAYLCILSVTLFWCLIHIHTLIFTDIIEPMPNLIICYLQPGIHLMITSYYSISIKGILIPLLMIIFGLWTHRNIRTTRVHPTHPKDSQLIRLLLTDISVYIVFSLMISIVLMYQYLSSRSRTEITSPNIQMQVFLVSIGLFNSYIPFSIVFYTNLLVSKSFRQEVRSVFK